MAQPEYTGEGQTNDPELDKFLQTPEYHALEALSQILADHRGRAIRARKQLGIEEEWYEDQEFYEGIDDANRAEHGRYRSKPSSGGTPSTEDEDQEDSTSSTVFPNITQPYCDGMAARVGDMLLPTDDKGWSIDHTPIPEMAALAESLPKQREIKEIQERYGNEIAAAEGDEQKTAQIRSDMMVEINELFRGQVPEKIQGQLENETAAKNPDATPGQLQESIAQNYQDLASDVEREQKVAHKKAKAAEKHINDWLVECQYASEVRKAIDSSSQVGTGVLKGPIPMSKQTIAYVNGQVVVQDELRPCTFEVPIWNCFPDPDCGESIHNGNFHYERDTMGHRQVYNLLKQEGYIEPMLRLVLQEGPAEVSKEIQQGELSEGFKGLNQDSIDRSNQYEIWYGYDYVKVADARNAGIDVDPDARDDDLMPVDVTMINYHIVRIKLHYLDTGEFPYDYMVLHKRAGLPYGTGVARQLRTCQRIIIAALRNMMDNAGLAGGPMWVYLEGLIEPLDDKPELRPRKGWVANIENLTDPRMLEHAIQYIQMDMMQDELERIIQLALKLAEDVTGMPLIMQGQQGAAPDTVGGMQILNDNASTILRRIARLFDDRVTEPHIRRYYAYLLQYGESDEEKGDFQIDARGSTALVERALNDRAIQEMAAVVENPKYGLDPRKWAKQWLKSKRLHAADFEFDDDEWQNVVESLAAAAQKGDSRVEVAQINAANRVEIESMRSALKEAELALEREREQSQVAVKGEQDRIANEMQIAFKTLERELAEMQEAGKQQVSQETIKAKLADTAMKIRAQLQAQAAAAGGGTPQIANPPTEPPGRAPDGQAYTQ